MESNPEVMLEDARSISEGLWRLVTPTYNTLKHRLENAHSAVEAVSTLGR